MARITVYLSPLLEVWMYITSRHRGARSHLHGPILITYLLTNSDTVSASSTQIVGSADRQGCSMGSSARILHMGIGTMRWEPVIGRSISTRTSKICWDGQARQ